MLIRRRGIDRLAALWQAGHPEEISSNWMDASEDVKDLVPFRNKDGDYFKSYDVRNWEDWGYSYEDTSTITNHNQLASRIRALYDDDTHVKKHRGAALVSLNGILYQTQF